VEAGSNLFCEFVFAAIWAWVRVEVLQGRRQKVKNNCLGCGGFNLGVNCGYNMVYRNSYKFG